MIVTLPGLVIRESVYGENLVCLTVLTGEKGRITVFTKESKNPKAGKSRNLAAAQLLCYSELVLYEKGGSFWLKEASIIESFFDLRKSIEISLLAYYIADVVNEVCVENSDESEMLSLALNTLYMLAKKDRTKPVAQIKGAFEMRCAAVSGFTPELSGCAGCGKDEGTLLYLDVMNGSLRCADCLDKAQDAVLHYDTGTTTLLLPVSTELLGALRYVTSCDAKKIFSFSLSEEGLRDFGVTAEKYLLNHLDRGFETLNIYKMLG